MAFGVVDMEWTRRAFPNNAKWDYAFYVVETDGAHLGADAGSESLEVAAGTMPVSFAPPTFDDAQAMGEVAPPLSPLSVQDSRVLLRDLL